METTNPLRLVTTLNVPQPHRVQADRPWYDVAFHQRRPKWLETAVDQVQHFISGTRRYPCTVFVVAVFGCTGGINWKWRELRLRFVRCSVLRTSFWCVSTWALCIVSVISAIVRMPLSSPSLAAAWFCFCDTRCGCCCPLTWPKQAVAKPSHI